jgi:hypothetical protein
MDGQMEIVNKWVEGYLRNYVSGQQRAWVRWLHLGEHCYNNTFHMSTGMTPFRALYGYDAPTLIEQSCSQGQGLDSRESRDSPGTKGESTNGIELTKSECRQTQGRA